MIIIDTCQYEHFRVVLHVHYACMQCATVCILHTYSRTYNRSKHLTGKFYSSLITN